MAFRWQAIIGPLLWYLDPLSPHQLKRHWIFFMSESKHSESASAKRERERERERESNYLTELRTTNEYRKGRMDKWKDENYTPLGIDVCGITSLDIDI